MTKLKIDMSNVNIVDICELIEKQAEEQEMNWDEALHLLRQYSSKYTDYNIFPDKLNNYQEFANLYDNIILANQGTEPMIQRTCRDCGEQFFMFKSEVDFFKTKRFPLPKRCKGCRVKRKQVVV